MTAYYNAPDDKDDLVAAFHARDEADEYAKKYGGNVTGVGVVFTVGKGADHAKAQADFKKLAEGGKADDDKGASKP